VTILITGVAGFIGSNLAKLFIAQGWKVIGIDNLSRGAISNINNLFEEDNFKFINEDISNFQNYINILSNIKSENFDTITEVWHMAANSDIPAGVNNAVVDLKDTFMTTFNTLEMMKILKIKTIFFASSSAVYGDLGNQKLVEEIGPLFPLSNYGAMKLASEAIISAAVESFLDKAYFFRFPNVIGVPATHGVMLDFIRKLKVTPQTLHVLGDGSQQKSYLHIDELIDAMLFIRNKSIDRRNFFNIGADDEGVTVKYIAEQVVKNTSPNASISYGLDKKGWVGDVPKFSYSVEKLHHLGWKPKLSSIQAVNLAVKQIALQEDSLIKD
jgi:UDP-glucose 4-epimerase